MRNHDQTAADLSNHIIKSLEPIISDSDATQLINGGWIKCVTDIERKWSQAIAEAVVVGGSLDQIEALPRVRYLRTAAKVLLATPRTYALEEKGSIGREKWEKEKHHFLPKTS